MTKQGYHRYGFTHCNELVARTPAVAAATVERDWTHLQYCGRPVSRNGKCRRHAKRPLSGVLARFRSFDRRRD